MAEQAGVSSSAHRNSIARKKKKKKESLQLCFLCAPTVNLSKSFALAKQQPWWWWPWDKHPHQQHCWHADFTGLAVEYTQVSCLHGVQFIKLVACSQGQFFPKLSARLLLVATATEVLVIAHRNPLGIAQTNKKKKTTRLAICMLSTLSLPTEHSPYARLLLKAHTVTVTTRFCCALVASLPQTASRQAPGIPV